MGPVQKIQSTSVLIAGPAAPVVSGAPVRVSVVDWDWPVPVALAVRAVSAVRASTRAASPMAQLVVTPGPAARVAWVAPQAPAEPMPQPLVAAAQAEMAEMAEMVRLATTSPQTVVAAGREAMVDPAAH